MLKGRGSGILLHLSSLPSPFGIGDMGEGAYRFADFLASSGQRFWQILPINVTASYHDHSPYMSVSAFAGNPLFISPVHLVQEGLLKKREIGSMPPFQRGYVDYMQAAACKEKIVTIAWRRFKERAKKDTVSRWEKFCQDNSVWLDDFALFSALRSRFRNAPWSQWPRDIRDRRNQALRSARKELSGEIRREQFRQFLFFDQWWPLKTYCNDRRIFIIEICRYTLPMTVRTYGLIPNCSTSTNGKGLPWFPVSRRIASVKPGNSGATLCIDGMS